MCHQVRDILCRKVRQDTYRHSPIGRDSEERHTPISTIDTRKSHFVTGFDTNRLKLRIKTGYSGRERAIGIRRCAIQIDHTGIIPMFLHRGLQIRKIMFCFHIILFPFIPIRCKGTTLNSNNRSKRVKKRYSSIFRRLYR